MTRTGPPKCGKQWPKAIKLSPTDNDSRCSWGSRHSFNSESESPEKIQGTEFWALACFLQNHYVARNFQGSARRLFAMSFLAHRGQFRANLTGSKGKQNMFPFAVSTEKAHVSRPASDAYLTLLATAAASDAWHGGTAA